MIRINDVARSDSQYIHTHTYDTGALRDLKQ